jgi:hypothetical protein
MHAHGLSREQVEALLQGADGHLRRAMEAAGKKQGSGIKDQER